MRLRLKKLDIFVAKQFLLLFVATFFICQFVLMMQFLWLHVDTLIGKGLSLDVLAEFFWYLSLNLVAQAMPLAILLSSLITYGNLGESMELTAIKASGVSLLRSMRPLIVIVMIITAVSYYFQDVISPQANRSVYNLLHSMQQTSPEVEIPEGTFYDGIPQSNIYVQQKDRESGMLRGVMIYRQTGSYEDHAIILADSGMLQSTADRQHLLLTLYSGEWFENMRPQDAATAEVPYRRETFAYKTILLDFDSNFNMTDNIGVSSSAKSKSMSRILSDLDSIRHTNDSVGHAMYDEAMLYTYHRAPISKTDSTMALRQVEQREVVFDSLIARLTALKRLEVLRSATQNAKQEAMNLEFKGDYIFYMRRAERNHQIEAIGKVTLALQCLIFFFIGAPLGAIIRKGGLGVPIIISVVVFIVYYIFDNSGMRMAREDEWTVWFGKLIAPMVLIPLGCFFTYKANNDSVVFNIDAYKQLLATMLGLRQKRNIAMKEVIITDPSYSADAAELGRINAEVEQYMATHQLLRWPNPIKVFFRPGDDRTIRDINGRLEEVIEDLGNTRDGGLLHYLNDYPIVATHAHTRPFRQKWLNIITGLVLPVGLFFYLRMLRFRRRLHRDLNIITRTNNNIIYRIETNLL